MADGAVIVIEDIRLEVPILEGTLPGTSAKGADGEKNAAEVLQALSGETELRERWEKMRHEATSLRVSQWQN
jgi:hypothetical protein